MSRSRRRWLVAAVLLTAACLPALREPPSLEELRGDAAAVTAEQLEETRQRAALLFERRSSRAVRESAELWLRAAAAERGAIRDWIGATRAYLWLADHLQDPEMRKMAARSAVHSAQWCERTSPDDPACWYWLAAALGMQARERRTTALDALPKIVQLLQRAAARDPSLDQGGPHRVLALLHVRAPSWPRGPGDPDKALEHARRAVELRPDYPPNLLALGEAQQAVDDRKGSRETYARALEAAREAARRDQPDAGDWVRAAERALGRKRRP